MNLRQKTNGTGGALRMESVGGSFRFRFLNCLEARMVKHSGFFVLTNKNKYSTIDIGSYD